MFPEFKIGYGFVVDNDDTNAKDGKRLGRIQVRVLPEMEGVDPEMLPWLRPFATDGLRSGSWSLDIPLPGSKIYVAYLDDNWKEGYYLHGFFLDGLINYDEAKKWVEDLMGNDTFLGDYPTVSLRVINNQLFYFLNKASGYVGIVHKAGSFISIDASGNITLKGKGQEKVSLTGGRVQVSANTVSLQADVENLSAKFLEIVAETLIAHGKTQPSPEGDGPFNCLPKCLFSGAPHAGFLVKNQEETSII